MRVRTLFGWSLIRADELAHLREESERRRSRNLEVVGEKLHVEAQVEHTRTQLADARAAFAHGEALRSESTARAELAEGIVRGQAKHIEQLQRSNDTMLEAITDMRRVGFSLPSDVLNSPDPDTISTVADDDLQAIKDYPHLAATDDD